jgi:DNA-directed RNA polymerase subunit K/omega
MLSRYELAELIGTRAQQIDKQGIHFAKLSDDTMFDLNALKIAAIEIE